MGVFNENGEGVYLIVVPKAIRDKIGKSAVVSLLYQFQ
jgi:hypothetical protein